MKPKGLVSAASITFQMSMSRCDAKRASSLISAMLTCRKVFSKSFVSSASAQLETGTVVATSVLKKESTISSESTLIPETTFGVD